MKRSMSRSVTSHRFNTTHGQQWAAHVATGHTDALPGAPRAVRSFPEEHPISSAAGAGVGKHAAPCTCTPARAITSMRGGTSHQLACYSQYNT